MKKYLVIALVVLTAIVATSVAAQASPREGFYLEKICPSLGNPNACDIQFADAPFGQLVGGQIIYNDRVNWENPAGKYFEIARIHLTTGNNSGGATGQVRWIKDHGLLTISQGTGSLAGLHVNAVVQYIGDTADGRMKFSVSGTYHVER